MLRKIGTFVLLCMMLLLLISCNANSEFKLNFIVDGEVYATLMTDGTGNITLPEEPSKNGYTFVGWFFDDKKWEKPFSKNSSIDGNVNVYAKWEELDEENQTQSQGQTQPHTCVPSNWIEDTPATCKASGTKHKECTVCKKVLESKSVAKLSTHREGERRINEKTGGFCGQSGTYSQTVFCKDCGIEISHGSQELPQKHQMKNGACEICGLPQSSTKGLSFYLKSDGTYAVTATNEIDENVVIGVYNDITVTEINGGCFSNRNDVKSVTIADCVTTIGDLAFYNCTSIKTIVIGNGVKEIPKETFWGCTSLRSVSFGDNVETIGYRAFKECNELLYVYITGAYDWQVKSEMGNKTTIYGRWIGKENNDQGSAAQYLLEYVSCEWTRK